MTTKSTGEYVLLIRSLADARERYLTAKKLFGMLPDRHFTEWKALLERQETIVVRRGAPAELDKQRQELASVCSGVDVVRQSTIGGSRVF